LYYVLVLFLLQPVLLEEGWGCRASSSSEPISSAAAGSRHRKEITQLQRAGISTTSAEALLDRMLDKTDDLCAERDRLKKERPRRTLERKW
jgi:hypothetical protein